MSCSIGRDAAWILHCYLWLWHWPAAAAPILPLAWELSYAAGAALRTHTHTHTHTHTKKMVKNGDSKKDQWLQWGLAELKRWSIEEL